jgi:putative endonuclease
MLDKPNTTQKGQRAEQYAARHLQQKGLCLLEANYRTAGGEIDLIMQDREEIVFVEVRFRQPTSFATALESVDPAKQKKIIKTATHYLSQRNLIDKVNCRFDVIGISYSLVVTPEIEWIQNAFFVDD